MKITETVARITWNDAGWTRPTGPRGKSGSGTTYEKLVGYGHEEWLFDLKRILKGMHYGFVEGVARCRESLKGQPVRIHLFTINAATHERLWLGHLDCTLLMPEESIWSLSEYRKRGWTKEMLKELSDVLDEPKRQRKALANLRETFDSHPEFFANVKFKPEDIHLLADPVPVSKGDRAVPSARYSLMAFQGVPKLLSKDLGSKGLEFKAGHIEIVAPEGKWVSGGRQSIVARHASLQTMLFKALVEESGKGRVGTEQPLPCGDRIDVVVSRKDGACDLYELKDGSNVRMAIREALSQLLDYQFSSKRKIRQLVIVTPLPLSSDSKLWLSHLKTNYGIPVCYRQINPENGRLLNAEP